MEVDPALALEISTLARQRSLQDAIDGGQSDIQRFYEGTTIFITGGTGFLGKQLIEKLLRSCPKIRKIYILTRPKKQKTVEERVAALTSEPLYNGVKKINPDFAKKITVMEGDIMELNLGLSVEDRKTVADEVNIIFHVAATTKFDEPLKKAVLSNVLATREVMTLGSTCTNLQALVHVSTAYCHCPLPVVKEEFYKSPVPYDVMLDFINTVDEDRLDEVMPSLIKPWPNTYAFTKAIGEDVVLRMGADLPVVVVRPAIVSGTYKEPAPGWLDISSVYGPSGVIVGSGMGVMHTFLAERKYKVDLVPADYVNNACIAAAYRTAEEFRNGMKKTRIYTMTSSKRNIITWDRIYDLCEGYCRWMVSPQAVWYCFNVIQANRFIHAVLTFLWHTLPATVIDGVSVAIGKEPKLRKLYDKMYRLNEVLSYFTLKQWLFDDTNTLNLHKSLSDVDRIIYQFDIESVDWKEYVQLWYLGVRRYIIKDDLKNTKLGARKQLVFRVGHYMVVALYAFVLWTVIRGLYSICNWVLI